MKTFWDDRYRESEFAYGKEPNKFFAEWINSAEPGKIFLPAEGEGRNAVYAATLGWDVYAVDYSKKGREKAFQLAEEFNVAINYRLESLENVQLSKNTFDVSALIYVHLPEAVFNYLINTISKSLKPGGQLIIEGYSKKQLTKSSGGPKNESLLYDITRIKEILTDYTINHLQETNIHLNEGVYHRGEASVIRAVATKK